MRGSLVLYAGGVANHAEESTGSGPVLRSDFVDSTLRTAPSSSSFYTKMPSEVGIISLDAAFGQLVGSQAAMRRLLVDTSGQQTFHEAGVYLDKHDKVFLSSNRLPCSQHGQKALIVAVPLSQIPAADVSQADDHGILPPLAQDEADALWKSLEIVDSLPHLAMPNGATKWDQDSVLWCEQGLDARSVPSTLVVHDISRHSTKAALSQYQGLPFSSLNDVVVHGHTGSVFFTDPDYGVEQSFKSHQTTYAPNALYVWQPQTNAVRLLDEQYTKPNGVTFCPSQTADGSGLLLTTDTGRFRFHRNESMGDFHVDPSGPARIYSYRVEAGKSTDGMPNIVVQSRALFAESTSGVPDGIHVDDKGNVWAGHGNGVHVYQPQSDGTGRLIGKFVLPGGKGVANFCWAGSCGEAQYRLLLFAEDELWEVIVGVNGQD